MKVGGDLTLESAEDTYTKESITKTSSKKLGGSKKSETKETIKTTTNIGSSLNVGGDLKSEVGNVLTIKGSEINVNGNADLKVGGDLEVLSVEDTYEKITEKSSSKKNLGGSEKVKEKERLKQTVNQGSSINVGGDLGVEAGGEVYLLGSELNSGGNTDITAERFTSEAAIDREEYSYEKTVEKTSLNLASVAAVIAPLTPLGGIVQAIGGMYGTFGTMASTTVLNATQASGFDYKDGKLSMELASVSKTKEYRGHTTETASESK